MTRDKDMDELFESVHFDQEIKFVPKSVEEDDEEDDTDTFEDVLKMFFPWSE